MNRSVLYSATAIIVIALAAGLSLVILRQGRDELANHAPQPRVRPESGKPGAIKQLVGESVDSPVRDDPGSPEDSNLHTLENNDSRKTGTDEKALREFIASMSGEDKQAKPQGYPMELWALFVANHHQQLKQNGDIEFYGKVVAEDGSPLPGVRILASVPSYEPSISKAIEMNQAMNRDSFQEMTDHQGLFRVKNKVGVKLIFDLFEISGYKIMEGTKAGYNFAPEEAKAALGPAHQAEPANPVIFKMVKAELKPGSSLDDLD